MGYDQIPSVGWNGEDAEPNHEPGMLRQKAHKQSLEMASTARN